MGGPALIGAQRPRGVLFYGRASFQRRWRGARFSQFRCLELFRLLVESGTFLFFSLAVMCNYLTAGSGCLASVRTYFGIGPCLQRGSPLLEGVIGHGRLLIYGQSFARQGVRSPAGYLSGRDLPGRQ